MALALTKAPANSAATGTIAPTASQGGLFEYTLTGNLTLSAPTGLADAQFYAFFINGPTSAGASFTVTFASAYIGMGATVLAQGDVLACAFVSNGGRLLPIGKARLQVDRANA
jgi:hypothetical protein